MATVYTGNPGIGIGLDFLGATLIYGDPAIIGVSFQRVLIDGSPTVFHFDPPIASVAEINPPMLLRFVLDQVDNHGAVIG